jgi:hypothetical protein
LIAANVSFSRVENYLLKEDLKKTNNFKKADKPFIKVTNLTTKWTKVNTKIFKKFIQNTQLKIINLKG